MKTWQLTDAPDPGEAGATMQPWPDDSCPHFSPTWADLLKVYAGTGVLGEIRSPEDWRAPPRDVFLRAVYLVDDRGPVLRWRNTETKEMKNETSHVHLLRGDGDVTVVRSGWIRISSDGRVKVS